MTQLGFECLLMGAEIANNAHRLERETGHLPSTMAEALPFYRDLLVAHDAAMFGGDIEEAMRLRDEADKLALRLNGGNPGILADDDAPGCVLERETAARPGVVPLWGQQGEFVIGVGTMRVRVEMDGIFGIGCGYSTWPGFAAHAVDLDRPFLSETGYRSFLGVYKDYQSGLTPGTFVADVLTAYIADEMKGRLLTIDDRWK
jgi:hypothetical protein